MAIAERPEVDEAEDTRERVTVWGTRELVYVHPIASLWPMLGNDELDDLADDIRRNGLMHPIVLDQHAQLVDGRNRLEACRRAEVAPDFITVTLEDPVAFILSANAARRHMNKGQLAMAIVRSKSFFKKDFAWGELAETATLLGVSRTRIDYAVAVQRHAPELSDRVIANDLALNDAYAAAIQSKRTRSAAEDEAKQHEADMARLRAGAADLAERVEDHRLDIKDALRQLAQREADEQERRQTRTKMLIQAVATLDPGQIVPGKRALELHRGLDEALLAQSGDMGDLGLERLRACRAVLSGLIELREAEDAEAE